MEKEKTIKKTTAVLVLVLLVLIAAIFTIAGCKSNILRVDTDTNTNTNINADKCPINMINPYACKQGAVTYRDKNNCPVTKCKEDLEGLQGSEKTKYSDKN